MSDANTWENLYAYFLRCIYITGSPAGLSCVTGEGPSSAKMVNSLAYKSHNYESLVLKFDTGDDVTRLTNSAKFGWDHRGGGTPTWR